MTEVVLKFISGPLQGCEFPLENGREVVIGRGEDAHLRIIEDTISRKHARIYFRNDEIVIEDLSRNGTYVNSRPIQKAILMPDDLVYIGRSVLKVATMRPSIAQAPTVAVPLPAAAKAAPAFAPRPAPAKTAVPAGFAPSTSSGPIILKSIPPSNVPTVRPLAQPSRPAPAFALRPAAKPQPKPQSVGTSTGEHFRGSIGDIALTDLLQLLSSSRKTGVLIIRSVDMLGKIYVEQGHICYATMDEVEPVNPQKVFFRLLRWTQGTFEFAPPDRREFPNRIDETNDHLLLEAMHELDEISNLGPDIPSLHAEVTLANPLPVPLKELAAGDLDFLQLAMRHKLVRDILDNYTGTDFEGYTYLKSLAGRGFFEIGL